MSPMFDGGLQSEPCRCGREVDVRETPVGPLCGLCETALRARSNNPGERGRDAQTDTASQRGETQ